MKDLDLEELLNVEKCCRCGTLITADNRSKIMALNVPTMETLPICTDCYPDNSLSEIKYDE